MSANAGELRRPLDEGAHHDAVIPKPVDFAVLLDIVAAKLGLRWTDLPVPVPASVPTEAAVDSGPAPALQPAQAAQLRDLALIGYVRGIRTRLDEMAAEDPPAAQALAALRTLVAQFRLDEFMAELDRMEAGSPP